ncbi:hypothetical protein QR680_006502 [Steinernema hermaphroditum]|uniref:Major facilitator superfamily (MFS) profile domain-containing protein n=1 Tax=Steinernema hermaphroditum TaxID=289476 RepID=A0AA39LWN8_9BILA|nr:hypothetical protein QR680_006502 [Steinernema hermaphroditum]
METEKEKLAVARLDDFTKLGRYSLLLCLFAELMILSQLGNMLYMMYAGSAPIIVGCGDYDLPHDISSKEACEIVKELQANSSCELKLDIQFQSVNDEWNYLCERTKEVKNSISMQMIGVMVGSVLFGQTSDMYGRKLTMLICLFGCITISFGSSYTHNLFWFTVCRFFIGVFNGGHIAVLLVFMIENLPKKDRLWINTVITWSPNMVIFAIVAYFAHDWRSLAQWSSILTIPAFLLCLYMYESPRFLIQKGKIDEARRVITGISKFNREKELDEALLNSILEKEHQILLESSGKKHYHFVHLFYTWKFATYTLVIAFSFMVTSIVNYGLLFNMEKVSGSIFWNSALIGLLRYAINLFAGLLDYKVKWIGRKAMHLGTFLPIVLCTLFIVAIDVVGEQYEFAFYSRIAILGVCAVISQIYITNGVCSNELFPTSIRNLSYAFSQLSSRLGVVISPQLFYLADFWTPLPYFTMTVLAAMDIVLFECLIPETKGHPLIDHMPGPEERIFASKKYRKVPKSDKSDSEKILA